MRPLGRIVGIEIKPKEVPKPVEPVEETKVEEPKEENQFWKKVGYKFEVSKLPSEPSEEASEEDEVAPDYVPPQQILKALIHTGVMRRVRMSKEKSEYKQIIFPNPKENTIGFKPDYFAPCLPSKFMVLDKKVKELKELKVIQY